MNATSKKGAIFAYARDVLISVPLYVLVQVYGNNYLEANEVSLWLTAVIALLPMVPLLYFIWGIMRFFNAFDELESKKLKDAAVVTFVTVSLAAFAYGMLEDKGFPTMEGYHVVIAMSFVWSIAQAMTARKYL